MSRLFAASCCSTHLYLEAHLTYCQALPEVKAKPQVELLLRLAR